MSRGFWYSDDEGAISPGLWNANVERSLHSRKGQELLRRLEAALLALPESKLIGNEVAAEGMVCTIGALEAHTRVAVYGWTWEEVLPSMAEEYEGCGNTTTVAIGKGHGFSMMAATEIATVNDEDCEGMSPEVRYQYMLRWVRAWILPATQEASDSNTNAR